jgi:hypothetical protein
MRHETESFQGWLKWKGYKWDFLRSQELYIEEAQDANKVFGDSRRVVVGGVPFVVVIDSTMPPDQIEFRNSNGQRVGFFNLAPGMETAVAPSSDA